eukprot:8481253-Alexandrium_andersonii.AAC.1
MLGFSLSPAIDGPGQRADRLQKVWASHACGIQRLHEHARSWSIEDAGARLFILGPLQLLFLPDLGEVS